MSLRVELERPRELGFADLAAPRWLWRRGSAFVCAQISRCWERRHRTILEVYESASVSQSALKSPPVSA
jgi:hypothetical protein